MPNFIIILKMSNLFIKSLIFLTFFGLILGNWTNSIQIASGNILPGNSYFDKNLGITHFVYCDHDLGFYYYVRLNSNGVLSIPYEILQTEKCSNSAISGHEDKLFIAMTRKTEFESAIYFSESNTIGNIWSEPIPIGENSKNLRNLIGIYVSPLSSRMWIFYMETTEFGNKILSANRPNDLSGFHCDNLIYETKINKINKNPAFLISNFNNSVLLHLAWVEQIKNSKSSGYLKYTRSHDLGLTWEEPEINIETTNLTQQNSWKADILQAGNNLFFGYHSYDDFSGFIKFSRNYGKNWEGPIEISNEKGGNHMILADCGEYENKNIIVSLFTTEKKNLMFAKFDSEKLQPEILEKPLENDFQFIPLSLRCKIEMNKIFVYATIGKDADSLYFVNYEKELN